MRMGQVNKEMARQTIQMQGMKLGHQYHDNALCNYADAAAQDVYEKLLMELPAMVDTAVQKSKAENPYGCEVVLDKKSVENVRKQIINAIKSAFK